jgi:hypothetical protein
MLFDSFQDVICHNLKRGKVAVQTRTGIPLLSIEFCWASCRCRDGFQTEFVTQGVNTLSAQLGELHRGRCSFGVLKAIEVQIQARHLTLP